MYKYKAKIPRADADYMVEAINALQLNERELMDKILSALAMDARTALLSKLADPFVKHINVNWSPAIALAMLVVLAEYTRGMSHSDYVAVRLTPHIHHLIKLYNVTP